MKKNVKSTKHNLKIFRRFNEDIWGRLGVMNKPTQVLNYVFEACKNTYKYRRLLRKKFYFFPRRLKKLLWVSKGQLLYRVAQKEREFKWKKRTLKINTYIAMLKLRRFYGNLKKRQFKRIVTTSKASVTILKKAFPLLLESRLDVILYRSNLFHSIFAARQFISHKKICVNGTIVNRCGFKVSIGDFISVLNPRVFYLIMRWALYFDCVLVNYPAYLEVNYKLGTILFTKRPAYNEIPFPCQMRLSVMAHKFSK